MFYEGTTEPKRQGVEMSPKKTLSQITGFQSIDKIALREKLICHGDLILFNKIIKTYLMSHLSHARLQLLR